MLQGGEGGGILMLHLDLPVRALFIALDTLHTLPLCLTDLIFVEKAHAP